MSYEETFTKGSRNETEETLFGLGVLTGIAAGDVINEKNIGFIQTWLIARDHIASIYPFKTIIQLINTFDSPPTSQQCTDLLKLIEGITGEGFSDTGAAEAESIKPKFIRQEHLPNTAYGEDRKISFTNTKFCFSGKFRYGSKKECEDATKAFNAKTVGDVTTTTDFLVIGSIPNPSWKFGSYGRKLQQAAKWYEEYKKPIIVSEDEWLQAIKSK